MAHCPPELLDDLTDVLTKVRGWTGVVEKKPMVFYLRREPFLHFHLVDGGRRRADIKGLAGWVQMFLPSPIRPPKRRAFLVELRRQYDERGRETAAVRTRRR